jgi:hypothetical protein
MFEPIISRTLDCMSSSLNLLMWPSSTVDIIELLEKYLNKRITFTSQTKLMVSVFTFFVPNLKWFTPVIKNVHEY